MSDAIVPIEVFCSYAEADEAHLKTLHIHLSTLKRQKLISTWHDHQVIPGTNRAQAIDTHLEQASVILLLVSPDYLASDSCYEIEMQRAIERHEAGHARVIPIIIRPCDWSHAPFAQLQNLPLDGKPVTIWDNHDLAWNDVAAGIRRAIEDLSLLTTNAKHSALPPVWNIPYPRNPFFLGRDHLLSRLHTELQNGQPTALSQPQAISGLGGIGKTHIAIEYAYQYASEYDVVLWARADNQEALISSYNTIATLLKLPERDASEQEIITQAIKKWLQTQSKWLLILDNADDLDLLPSILPPVLGGHLLITTRAWDMQRLASRIAVKILPNEQGALFLLRRAALIASDADLSQASIQDRALAIQITQELGGLPLALDQAGAYLEATGISLSQYQQVYQKHRQALLQERRARMTDHPEPVATTWSLSFKRVEEQNKASADLLRITAYLAPDAIPESIITRGAPHLGPLLAPVAADPYLFSQTIEALRAYSLIQRDPRTQTLSVHRLVQAVLRDSMGAEAEKEWKQRVVKAVNASCPKVNDVTQWNACEQWLPHARECATWIEQAGMTNPEASRMLNEAGYYLKARARYAEAEPMYRRALEINEEELGARHPDTARSLNNLALLYQTQGKYAEAEPMYRRALEINKEELGARHPDTARSLNNLALLYQTQGKYAEAEPMYRRALEIREEELGARHPDTALSLNNLAALYNAQGKYAEAEALLMRALEIREEELGARHPDTAAILNNLAELYRVQGKYAEAEPMYRRALEIREEELGARHPDTARSLNNLAALYDMQGKYAEAEPLFQHALAIREQALGPSHPDTAHSVWWLATVYERQQQYEQAKLLYQRALSIFEQMLGADHHRTQSLRRGYTALLRKIEANGTQS